MAGRDTTTTRGRGRPRSKHEVKFLIVGYGNTLRSDDAAGPLVVEEIQRQHLPGVTTLVCPLLTPELAEPVSRAATVVFVDASIEPNREVRVRPIQPADSSRILAHAANPQTLLAISRDIFGHMPRAWCLTIPVEDLELGENLSKLARQGVRKAVKLITGMIAG